jgi:hypothetical protein
MRGLIVIVFLNMIAGLLFPKVPVKTRISGFILSTIVSIIIYLMIFSGKL